MCKVVPGSVASLTTAVIQGISGNREGTMGLQRPSVPNIHINK